MCGGCHPGGGPVEYDRDGNRYDTFAADPKNGILPGGPNGLDGDYFKAKWAESGVLEADCLICHLEGYDNPKRKAQIMALNYRWAATVGGGFGDVEGAVIKGQAPKVTYRLSRFRKDGKVLLPLVRETPNENCLFCHRESDWKKRGQSYSERSDVHVRAGIRCVDCHVAARTAEDPRIRGREVHQFGKGDDPGDFVRDDLDNTMRRCEDCHLKGILNAPVIRHKGLPPVHLRKIACQTCHIPWRQVKAALVQDASVFNTSPRIWPPTKRLWSFYGPDMKPWNYYGEAHSYPEGLQPLFRFRPTLGWYKGKIYPLNRVYTRWVGIRTKGRKGINQPLMKDIFMMWKKHAADPDGNFPRLKEIRDDNRDGFPEVNRPEEIRALLASVALKLKQGGASLDGKQVVFVDGDRYTTDGVTWSSMEKAPYEYSPYGSVFKYSHDIGPAKNGLGAKGCADCHGAGSDFFFKKIMVRLFGDDGRPVMETNAAFLGFTRRAIGFMTFQNGTLKSLAAWAILIVFALLLLHYILFGPKRVPEDPSEPTVPRFSRLERVLHYTLLLLSGTEAVTGLSTFWSLPVSSDALGRIQAFHHVCGFIFVANLIVASCIWARDAVMGGQDLEWLKKLGGYFGERSDLPAGRFNAGQKIYLWVLFLMGIFMGITGITALFTGDENVLAAVHCLHVIGALVFILMVLAHVYLGLLANPGTMRGMFEGKVTSAWARKHHPLWKPKGGAGDA